MATVKHVYSIWSEWDIGEEHSVYETEELAMEALRRNPNIPEILETEEDDLEGLIDAGLITINRAYYYHE